LTSGFAYDSSALGNTKVLIDRVRTALAEYKDVIEDGATKGKYHGFGSVSLEIASGKVILEGTTPEKVNLRKSQ